MRSGDQKAMAQLYDRYSAMVYAVALRVLGNAGAAEDVLQEVFMQLWRNPAAFDGHPTPKEVTMPAPVTTTRGGGSGGCLSGNSTATG